MTSVFDFKLFIEELFNRLDCIKIIASNYDVGSVADEEYGDDTS